MTPACVFCILVLTPPSPASHSPRVQSLLFVPQHQVQCAGQQGATSPRAGVTKLKLHALQCYMLHVTILTITPANNFQNTSAICWLLWFLPPALFRSVCHAMLLLKLLEAFFRFKLTVKCSLMLALSGLGWIRNQDSQPGNGQCLLAWDNQTLTTHCNCLCQAIPHT